jgi:hypothetical protein
MKYKLLFLSSLLCFAIFLLGCKSIFNSNKVKVAEKQEIVQKKEADKEYKKLVEAHNKRQTTSTKQRMEESKKRAEYYNRSKKKSFFQQLFGSNPKHKKPKKKKKN